MGDMVEREGIGKKTVTSPRALGVEVDASVDEKKDSLTHTDHREGFGTTQGHTSRRRICIDSLGSTRVVRVTNTKISGE